MKQGTLLNWRSASLSNSTPPVPLRPEPPLEGEVLDLTGSDDEKTIQEPGGAEVFNEKPVRLQRDE